MNHTTSALKALYEVYTSKGHGALVTSDQINATTTTLNHLISERLVRRNSNGSQVRYTLTAAGITEAGRGLPSPKTQRVTLYI